MTPFTRSDDFVWRARFGVREGGGGGASLCRRRNVDVDLASSEEEEADTGQTMRGGYCAGRKECGDERCG